jgi:hypothetical protein
MFRRFAPLVDRRERLLVDGFEANSALACSTPGGPGVEHHHLAAVACMAAWIGGLSMSAATCALHLRAEVFYVGLNVSNGRMPR